MSDGQHNGLDPFLYKNGVTTQIGTYASGEVLESASLSAVLALSQGDEITVASRGGNREYYGDTDQYLTHFVGTLLTRT